MAKRLMLLWDILLPIIGKIERVLSDPHSPSSLMQSVAAMGSDEYLCTISRMADFSYGGVVYRPFKLVI